MALSANTLGRARRAAAALKRAGYTIGAILERNRLLARRALRGPGELRAETARLVAMSADLRAVDDLPERAQRPFPRARGPLPAAAFKLLRDRPGWRWSWTAADRRGRPVFLPDVPGWIACAWCSLHDDRQDESSLRVGFQLFLEASRGHADSADAKRVKAAALKLMRPAGYQLSDVRWLAPRPTVFIMEKSVHTLAAARRERAVLDTRIFGD
jgi:hypothetical protein